MTEFPPCPYDLLSLVLTLAPLPSADEPAEVPPWWGRAAQALLLDLVRRADPSLAQSLHDDPGTPPYTTSTLMGHFREHHFLPGETYTLRLTALNAPLSGILWQAAQPGGTLAPGAKLELDYRPLTVQAAAWQPQGHPWAAATTYTELAAGYLMPNRPPDRHLALLFTSPTAFRTNGHNTALPTPELVFGSLLNRWNAFSPLTFPPEMRRYAAECLVASRFELSSRVAPGKDSSFRVGAVGQATYTSTHYDRYWMSVSSTLAAYSLFAGVGAATGAGMGQCRRVESGSSAAPS